MAKAKPSPKGKTANKTTTAVKSGVSKTVSSPKTKSSTLSKGKERGAAVKSTRTLLPDGPRKRKNETPHEVESDDEDEDSQDEDDNTQDHDDQDNQDDQSDDSELEEGGVSDAHENEVYEAQEDDATDEDSSSGQEDILTIDFGFLDNGAHIPPDPSERGKNGRKPGRNLIPWQRPCMNDKYFLFYQYECMIHGMTPPVAAIAHRLNPGSSESALWQHTQRHRDEVLGKGYLVPPPFIRPKTYVIANEHLVRAYLRVDKLGSPRIQVRAVCWYEDVPDNQFDRVDYNAYDKRNDEIWNRADFVDKDGNVICTAEERKLGKRISSAVSKTTKKTKKADHQSSSPTAEDTFDNEPPTHQVSTKSKAARKPKATPKAKATPKTKPAPKKRAAAKSKKTAAATALVETSSSDADYDPSGKATPKRRRPSRAKRVKTYHEPDPDQDFKEAASVSSEPAVAHEGFQTVASPDVSGSSLHPQSSNDEACPVTPESERIQYNHGAAAFEAEMSNIVRNDTSMDAQIPASNMATPSLATPDMVTPLDNDSQYAPSGSSHLSSPCDLPSSELVPFSGNVNVAPQAQQLSEMIYNQTCLPLGAFAHNNPNTHFFAGHTDGAPPSSTALIATSNNGEVFFGHSRGYSGSVHKADPGMAIMPGAYAYQHQAFGAGMDSMISQGMGSEAQDEFTDTEIHNGQVFPNHGFSGGHV
ncbi:hypothetical protein SBRCBS47491_003079 [Sporothrix bragantina]|uniref:Uncharacterized protein n=1 Tax=Sporothrix bragantina TaxID=671064 RepID=A0ABP0BC23_9PEZI